MDLVGSDLSLATCLKIRSDIQEHAVPWLEAPEQEAALQTKLERLAEAVIQTETKIRAREQGLITDGIIFS